MLNASILVYFGMPNSSSHCMLISMLFLVLQWTMTHLENDSTPDPDSEAV